MTILSKEQFVQRFIQDQRHRRQAKRNAECDATSFHIANVIKTKKKFRSKSKRW